MTSERPPFQCQYADRDRVGEFLDDPSAVANDSRWAEFGFGSREDYAHWAPRLCGVACARMVLGAHGLATGLTMAELMEAAVAAGAYGTSGWAYAPLVDWVAEYGLAGAVRAPYAVDQLVDDVALGAHPIVSVHPQVIRGELPVPPSGESGGHLVLVVDASADAAGQLQSVTVHNPNARTRATQESCVVTPDRFAAAFAGRGLALWS